MTVKLPFSEASIDSLLFVVPTTELRKKVLLIIDTNIINMLKPQESEELPDARHLEFMSIYNNWLGGEIDNYTHFATHGTKCFVPRTSNKEFAI